MPEASTPERQRRVAVDDDLRLGVLHRGNPVLEVEVLLGPEVTGIEQPLVDLDDLPVLLAERQRDLLAAALHVEAVDVAEHPEHEHVLALARVGDQLAALALQRHLVDAEARFLEHRHRLPVRLDDLRVAVLAPHALEQDLRAGLQLAGPHAAQQHLLVERDDEVGLVAAVGHLLRADADADARGAGDAARRRLDFGGNDLGGPDPVARPRGDGAERLAAALRALARVADDLDDVLGQRLPGAQLVGQRRRAGGARRQGGSFAHVGSQPRDVHCFRRGGRFAPALVARLIVILPAPARSRARPARSRTARRTCGSSPA